MKVGITCGGIGPYASGHFIRESARAAEAAGFAHYWMPEHVVQFADYPESTYPYAAGQFFWFERVGGVASVHVGGDGTFASATPYYTFATDASDTDRPKIAISLQNASVRVIYYPL